MNFPSFIVFIVYDNVPNASQLDVPNFRKISCGEQYFFLNLGVSVGRQTLNSGRHFGGVLNTSIIEIEWSRIPESITFRWKKWSNKVIVIDLSPRQDYLNYLLFFGWRSLQLDATKISRRELFVLWCKSSVKSKFIFKNSKWKQWGARQTTANTQIVFSFYWLLHSSSRICNNF